MWNEPLIVFPGQLRKSLSGSPIVPSNSPNGITVTLFRCTLPVMVLPQMNGANPTGNVPVIEIPPSITAVKMSTSENAPTGAP